MLTAAGVALASASASAQTPPDTLEVRADVVSTFDTNMLRLSEERAPGDRDDVRVTPRIDIDVRQLIGGRHQLTVGGNAGYDFNARNTFLDRERIDLNGDVNVAVGAFCTIRPGVRLNWAQSQLADQGEIVGNTERRTDYDIALACRRPVGLYPRLRGRVTRVTNSADARSVYNLDEHFVEAGLGYSLPSLGDVLLIASYERFDRPELREEVDRNDRTETYRAGLEFRRAVAPRVSFRASAYYIHVDAEDDGWSSFSGIGFRTGVEYRPAPSLETDIQFSRDISNQSNIATAYTIQTEARLNASYRPSPRSQVRLGGGYVHRVFRGQLIVDTPYPRDRDTTWGVFAGYSVDVTRRLRAALSVRHEERDAPLSYYRFVSTSGAASLSVRF